MYYEEISYLILNIFPPLTFIRIQIKKFTGNLALETPWTSKFPHHEFDLVDRYALTQMTAKQCSKIFVT
jgi:hypothetical protein